MNITAKQIQRSNIIVAYKDGTLALPDPAQMFSLYPGADGKGAVFSDAPSMGSKIFDFPATGFQWIFEPGRVRLEERKNRPPQESALAKEIHRVIQALYPNAQAVAYGFNYDIIYRVDSVIPIQEIAGSFVESSAIEDVRNFGWQYTLVKEKGKRTETYFWKTVSPIEYNLHANFHFNNPTLPASAELQSAFEKRYIQIDERLKHIKF